MNVPSGYSALDLVGFTDKGDYSPSATYVKNDLVHYNGAIWKCLIDDTTGIVPTTGVNWDIWIDQSTSLDGLTDVEITNATDGQEVTYDATTQKWKNTSKIQTLTNQVNDMNNVLGAKNLLPNQALNDTWKGITWKVNSDGTLSASGTATENSIRIIVEAFEIPVGKYILNGCPSGSGLSTYYLNFSVESGTVTPNGGNDIGEGLAFEVTQTAKITVKARVLSGQTVDITFRPMIRLASITDDTYEPYAKTNQQLTKETTGLIDNQNVNGAVNMLPTDIATQVLKGATITHNSDGSYSVVKSTADSQSGSILSTAFTLKAGTYYWCASQNGHSAIGSDDCYCFIKGINGTVDWYRSTDFDVNRKWGVITLTQDSSIQFGIEVGTGTSNFTFYPMITVPSYNGDYVPYAKSNKELTEEVTNAWIGKPRTGWINLGNKTTLTITVPITPYGGTYMQGSIKLFGYNNNVLVDCSLAFNLSRNNDSVAGSKLSNYSDSAVTLGSIAADGTKVTITLENLTTYVNLQVIYGTSMNGAYVDNTNMPEWAFN